MIAALAETLRWLRSAWLVRLISVAWRRFGEDNSFALSGYLAYTGLLSFFPFMIFIIVIGGLMVGEAASMAAVEELFRVTPKPVRTTLQPILEAIIASKTGLLAFVSAGVGLWAGSNAFEAARVGFNLAYDVREDRHFVRRRLQSLALAAAAVFVFVSLAFLIVLWPSIAQALNARGFAQGWSFDVFYVARYAIGLPMLIALLAVLHLQLPKGRRSGAALEVYTEHNEHWRIPVAPGVIASVVLWFLGATAFSLYLQYAPSFAGNYGAMAGVVITLLFFYMSAVIVFFGAQINIAAEELRRHRRIKGGELPAFALASDFDLKLPPTVEAAAIEKAGGDRELARMRHALRMQG